jgi:hypothetical protein
MLFEGLKCPVNAYFQSAQVSNFQCKLLKKGRKATTSFFLEKTSYLFKLSKVCDFKEALYRILGHLLIPFKFIKRQRGGKSLYIAVPTTFKAQIRSAATLALRIPSNSCNLHTRLPVRVSYELGTLESFSQEVLKHDHLLESFALRSGALRNQQRRLWQAGIKKNRRLRPRQFQKINLEYSEMLAKHRNFLQQASALSERVYEHPAPALLAIKAAFTRASETIANRGIIRRELSRKKF